MSENRTHTFLDAPPEEQSFVRAPRPYHHDGQDVHQDLGHRPRPVVTPNSTSDHRHSPWASRQASRAPSESGTEADDERPSLIKALPAPTLRPRKGLRTGELTEEALLTPSQLDDDGRRRPPQLGYFLRQTTGEKNTSEQQDRAEEEEEEVLRRRRRYEFLRRMSEVGLMGVIVLSVLCGRGVAVEAWKWRWELLSHVIIMVILIAVYPVKLSIVDTRARHTRLWQRFRVPASFDPATVLYPPLLPVLVALSVAPKNTAVVLPNIILGLSSLPQRLFPRSTRSSGLNVLHWFLAVVPLILSENISWLPHASPSTPYHQKCGPQGLSIEVLVALYPLHHVLMQPLHYLTSTSLLVSELHLLSAALINLLLLASSPQVVILKSCLWIGGVAIFVFCRPVLSWNLTLARVPKWRLRRDDHPADRRKSLIDAVSELVSLQRAASAFRSTPIHDDSDADEDEPRASIKQKPLIINSKLDTLPQRTNSDHLEPKSAIEPRQLDFAAPLDVEPTLSRPRSNTLPAQPGKSSTARQPSQRKRGLHGNAPWYLQLTVVQAVRRKWLYAAFTYAAIAAIILGPVKYYVGIHALNREPIGWAIGYLFGQLPYPRYVVESLSLQAWVPLPVQAGRWEDVINVSYATLPLPSILLRSTLGAANTRLLLFAYFAAVLAAGLLIVFTLTSYVEVDTRRKVFHGVMVAMLLPAVYVDPCYCALGLASALIIFLLLEVIRAGQVAPLGNAIGRFVAPYVDGRDLRGPVVVSHIFLLVGCAVPLWFSLASFERSTNELTPAPLTSSHTSDDLWHGWDLRPHSQREVAMLAGVVCVGMGDAAASLVGRRIGRHKWRWVGGKSLEGSAAFALAVTLGLVAAKIWLLLGGWRDDYGPPTDLRWNVLRAAVVLFKAAFCASAASFMEAVLTGANDNVVVPIALWLLVKGVQL